MPTILQRYPPWQVCECDQGVYYYNEATKESTWTKPAEVAEAEAQKPAAAPQAQPQPASQAAPQAQPQAQPQEQPQLQPALQQPHQQQQPSPQNGHPPASEALGGHPASHGAVPFGYPAYGPYGPYGPPPGHYGPPP